MGSILLCNLGLFWTHPPSPFCPLDISITPRYLVAWVLVVSAAYISRQCYHSLGHLFTFDLSIKKNHRLVQSGPYSVVRHPAYTGILLLNCGIMITHSGFGSDPSYASLIFPSVGRYYDYFIFWASALAFYALTKRANLEDRVLMHQFGEDWKTWERKVPFQFIPGLL